MADDQTHASCKRGREGNDRSRFAHDFITRFLHARE
jgi:hypothetical protein